MLRNQDFSWADAWPSGGRGRVALPLGVAMPIFGVAGLAMAWRGLAKDMARDKALASTNGSAHAEGEARVDPLAWRGLSCVGASLVFGVLLAGSASCVRLYSGAEWFDSRVALSDSLPW